MHKDAATDISNSSPSRLGSGGRARVAIVGARGYSGLELVRLLLKHPQAELAACFATSSFNLGDDLPEGNLEHLLCLPTTELASWLPSLQTVFLATPAEASLELAPLCLKAGVNVIDLSGAFRLADGDTGTRMHNYAAWYGISHTTPELLTRAHYGLVPWAGPLQGSAPHLIANPGCYVTASLMALLPLLKNALIQPESIVLDGKSGTTGGGRKASESLLFSEVDGECLAYKPGTHQHLIEIQQGAKLLTQTSIEPFFTTHLLSVRRGIVISLYARLNQGKGLQDVERAFNDAYRDYPLVTCAPFESPQGPALLKLKRVVGSPRTHLTYRVVGDKLYVFSLIDNLLKGAAAQAVENFNRLLDQPVATGLTGWEGVL